MTGRPVRDGTLIWLGTLGVALVVLTACGLGAHLPGAADPGSDTRQALFVLAGLAATAAYLLAAWRVLREPGPPRAVWFVLGAALVMRLMVLAAPPFLSSDLYRYVWDGRVQLAGINPFRYVPADPALASLRDEAIYPHIDRAYYAHTIYPPAAQLVFRAISAIRQTDTAERAAMLGFDLLAILLMMRLLGLAGQDRARVLIYAWNPLSVWEFAGNGHVDAVAIALLAAAMLARTRGRGRGTLAATAAGVALGAAALVKFLPLAAAPAFWRPQDSRRWRDWTVPAATVATMALLYLPFLSGNADLLGFLPGYAAEEGFGSGRAIFWLDAFARIVPLPAAAGVIWLAAAAIALIGTGLWMTLIRPPPRAGDPVPLARDVALLGTLLTLAVTPHYPWYFVWLALPSCLAPMPATILLSAIPILQYHDPYRDRVLQFGQIYLPVIVVWAVWAWRGRTHRAAPSEAAVRSL